MNRRVGLFLAVAVVFPLVAAANAAAQGAVLTITPKTAKVGDEVRVTGTSFSSAAGLSPVFIRLNTRTSEPLRETIPDARGNIDVTFPLPPRVTPGQYLVIATQTTANGRQRAFTPARTRLQVVSAAAAAAGGNAPAGGPSAPVVLAVMLGLILLGGAALTIRRLRTAGRTPLGDANTQPDA